MKYRFIENNKNKFSVLRMCSVFQVSSSGYYEWRGRPPSKRTIENQRLGAKVKEIFINNRRVYGTRRIQEELLEDGENVSRYRIGKLMSQQNMKCKTKKKFKVTTDSNHDFPVAPNLLDKKFDVQHPDQVYVGDITYIPTSEGWLYLAVFIDLYSRMVVGWSMSNRINAKLTCDSLLMAIWKRKPSQGLMVHSDRGSQYASHKFQGLLKTHSYVCSMSRKGNCWDNAPAESFFHTLKTELVNLSQYKTREEAKKDIFEYIEVFYNRQRRHSTIGYLSPLAYEEAA
ncbi:MAG: IS3 family transposase [Magnetococcales bacterium]|nr:IS3 family transposase [Magnetococcales bacterium]